MGIIKKSFLVLVTMLIVVALMSGCNKKKENTDKETTKNQNEKIPKKLGPDNLDSLIEWYYILDGSYFYYSSPILSSDEMTLYIGTSSKINVPLKDNNSFIALNHDGTLK